MEATGARVLVVVAVVVVGGAGAAGILGVAFPLALVARDARFPCTLAFGDGRQHGWADHSLTPSNYKGATDSFKPPFLFSGLPPSVDMKMQFDGFDVFSLA